MRALRSAFLPLRLARTGGAALAVLLLTAPAAHAQSITTTFAGGNNLVGNMFNVTTFGNDLFITAMDINVSAWNGANLLVYFVAGGYQGNENNAGAWTLVSNSVLASVNPVGAPTPVALTPFGLAANSVFGFYVTFDQVCCNNLLEYTSGSSMYANADLQLDLGIGNAYPFGQTFSPRTWNGTLYYDVGSSNVVPEPISMVLLGTGLAGLAAARRRRRRDDDLS